MRTTRSLGTVACVVVLCVWLLAESGQAHQHHTVTETYPEVPNCLEVERVPGHNMTLEEFYKRFTYGLGKPVVFTNLTSTWPARKLWTFEYFEEKFGNQTVTITKGDDLERKKTTIAEYIQYLREGDTSGTPWYMINFVFANKLPELLNDFTVPHLFKLNLMDKVNPNHLRWLFFGVKGSGSAMHSDTFNTGAWLTTLQGRKRWVLYPPNTLNDMEEVDAFFPQPRKCRQYMKIRGEAASGYHTVLHPGEMIFVPPTWAHQVVNIDNTLALTINFMSPSNIRFVDEYFAEMLAMDEMSKYDKVVKRQIMPMRRRKWWKKAMREYTKWMDEETEARQAAYKARVAAEERAKE